MKTCLHCQTSSDDESLTCSACGEGSFGEAVLAAAPVDLGEVSDDDAKDSAETETTESEPSASEREPAKPRGKSAAKPRGKSAAKDGPNDG